MRLTTVIIIASLMQVSATTFAQRITINQRNASLTLILKEIRKQSGYDILSDTKAVLESQKVTVTLKDAELEEALNSTLKGLNLTYEIKDRIVTIKRKETPSFFEKVIANFRAIDVRGKVVDEKGEPLVGATVSIKGKNRSVKTNSEGLFYMENVGEDDKLVISYVGYQNREFDAASDMGSLMMVVVSAELEEVKISTGYQTLKLNEITGSATLIDNKMLNRAVSPDLLSRLKGMANGLLFDSGVGNSTGISIRGRSTINSNTKPLVVIDNFPFEGDLNTINPNDVESVTILKDAAAASIWGVRAGNGVIVITSKKGALNKKATVSFNSNITIGDKPDLFYQPQLSSSEFIELEKFLYDQGHYTPFLGVDWYLVSPVVELLSKKTAANALDIDSQIEALKQYDSRNQINKYFYRRSLQQQYFLNVNGGGASNSYNISAGFDHNAPNQVANSTGRFTLRASNGYSLLADKLKVNSEISFIRSVNSSENSLSYSESLFPYEQIADAAGNALAVLKPGGLRASYTDTAGQGRLLDWKYKPLEELRRKSNTFDGESTDIRLNLGLEYQIIPSLSLSLNYQYSRSIGTNEILNDLNSFHARNEINQVTQIDPVTNELTYPMPMGAFLSKSDMALNANYVRGQINYQTRISNKHRINAIAGYEIRSDESASYSSRLYGYNADTEVSIAPDNFNYHKYFYNGLTVRFNDNNAPKLTTLNNSLSYYLNGSYGYDDRYIVSGSLRKDETNLFGVNANQKGVPLWSTGVAWNVNNEKFYSSKLIPTLQLKLSYGHNGNVNQSISAYTTASNPGYPNFYSKSPFLNIVNPPNPSLRWEKVENLNLGLNFGLKNQILTGSFEFYNKNGTDLIGTSPIAPQAGVISYTGNVANTRTTGFDVQLNSQIFNRIFKWSTSYILNIARDKVTSYFANSFNNEFVVATFDINPIVDYPIRSIFSFKSPGLNNEGNPIGYYQGKESTDYTEIRNSTDFNELKFHGSAVPTIFGALRNDFSYKGFQLSLNISYKFNYSFRRGDVLNYSSLFNGGLKMSGYAERWKNPGDEKFTDIPSLVYPSDPSRDTFYRFTEKSIEKGDHIRLNDIQFAYNVPDRLLTSIGFKSASIYAYANNLGIIWSANNKRIDPDAVFGFPQPKQFSIGIKSNF